MRKRGLIAVLALSLFLGGCMQSDQEACLEEGSGKVCRSLDSCRKRRTT